ncbi:MAG TPA: hypothetical protein VJN95_12720 [Gemmatimonadales bacterium]|nr:hypothetical protein [Gemmatimonadales bacterium]
MTVGEDQLDSRFRAAVAAMDAGRITELERLVSEYPRLVSSRLERPGPWLRDKVPNALKGFFAKPYLLWFVAEDPVRNDRIADNVVDVMHLLIGTARRTGATNLQEQLDTTLRLVCWSWVAARQKLQIPMIDVLIDAGAAPAENAQNALVNGHLDAAAHLLERGGTVTLAAALTLGRFDDVPRLARAASPAQRQFAFVLAALNGRADGVAWMIRDGIPINQPSADLYPHGTPLHHAVASGSLDTVEAMLAGGADRTVSDTAWNGTPLGWAQHYVENAPAERRERYRLIAELLRSNGER